MKNAKDYIEVTAPNVQRITSLAYWLTPEGLDDPITAEMLQRAIKMGTDEEFNEAFDGATRAEAAKYLEQWELCYMSYWGAPELVRAITLSSTRNEPLALRAVILAQSMGELPEVFTPTTGIKWAMARGYLIGSICKMVGVQPGNYGHPSNPLSIDDTDHLNPSIQIKADGDAGAVDDAGTKPNERELTAWLREAWIKEGKPGGTAFFNGLKKYAGGYGSPITQCYTAGKNAGFKWITSAGTTGEMPKKTLLNKVGIFKRTP
ncbi:MAG: hypothetical protein Q7U66_01805 [Methylobacter sp.]|nr:hypothetical protein [Methylobacter sp.]